MLKTGLRNRHEGSVFVFYSLARVNFIELHFFRKTEDKIALMEAKLRQMESTNPKPKAIPTPPDVDMDDRPSTPTSSSLPYNPSLPKKPPPQLPIEQSGKTRAQLTAKPKKTAMVLPSLPILPSSSLAQGSSSRASEAPILKASSNAPPSMPTGSGTHHRTAKSSKLVGVKIKPKEKDGPNS
jgi:hypothetical protein